MGEQVRGHERPVRVAANADPAAIRHTAFNQMIDRGARVGDQLFDITVVGFTAVLAHDRHGWVVEHAIAQFQ